MWVLAMSVPSSPARGPEAKRESHYADSETLDAGVDAGPLPEFLQDRVASGLHWRFVSQHGPVHVWSPPGYRHDSAGIAVYVHGYYTDVDEAWIRHRLAEQFYLSGRNALFIAPEAPAGRHAKVRWRDLGHLIREVRRRVGVKRPWGPVVALGHSGAYRTVASWLDYRPLEQVILLDALYGREHAFREWLEQVKGRPNRLTMVAIDTLRWSELFVHGIGYAHARDWVPRDMGELSVEARSSRFVYMRSQYGHMELITQGEALPVLLQMTRLPPIPAPGG